MEEQSLAAARGVAEGRRVRGGFGGGADKEEMYEHSVDLAAAVGILVPGPSPALTPTAALFDDSPPPPQLATGHGVVIGKKTVGNVADHWTYNFAGEVAHLKRFELYLEEWQQALKDREDALNRREREVEDAVCRQEREVAYLKHLELHLQNWQKFLGDMEEALNRREREVEEALSRRERRMEEAQLQTLKVQEDTLGTEGPLLLQLQRKLGVVAMIVVANVLVSLHHIRTLLPRGYFTGIVLALAILWAPSSVFLSNKVSGRCRSRRKFSYHVARLISLCFSVTVVYILYLLSAY